MGLKSVATLALQAVDDNNRLSIGGSRSSVRGAHHGVQLLRASGRKTQSPRTRRCLELEVPEVGHHDGVDDMRLCLSSEHQLYTPGRHLRLDNAALSTGRP
jgi:hypothetical protein